MNATKEEQKYKFLSCTAGFGRQIRRQRTAKEREAGKEVRDKKI